MKLEFLVNIVMRKKKLATEEFMTEKVLNTLHLLIYNSRKSKTYLEF